MVESNYKFFGFGLRSAQKAGKRVIVLIRENALTWQRTLGWIFNRVAYWDLTGGYSENGISHCPPISKN